VPVDRLTGLSAAPFVYKRTEYHFVAQVAQVAHGVNGGVGGLFCPNLFVISWFVPIRISPPTSDDIQQQRRRAYSGQSIIRVCLANLYIQQRIDRAIHVDGPCPYAKDTSYRSILFHTSNVQIKQVIYLPIFINPANVDPKQIMNSPLTIDPSNRNTHHAFYFSHSNLLDEPSGEQPV
jgi:hypothetical protein